MRSRKLKCLIPLYCLGVLLLFVGIFAIAQAREAFKILSVSHPFVMGFLKFALLATAGELLAARFSLHEWKCPCKIVERFLIWGLIGVWITYMMKMFSAGVAGLAAEGVLPGENSIFLKALFTSATMNLTFGPTFMAVHKCSDKWLELCAAKKDSRLPAVIIGVDWTAFVTFTLFKTVPLFWIPAHTITFMLPAEYQVTAAALLSVALGMILSLKK